MARKKSNEKQAGSEQIKIDEMAAESIVEMENHRAASQDVEHKKTEIAMSSEIDAVRDDSRAIGILQKIQYDNAHNELLKYAVIFQVKQSKAYRKGGSTWAEFCETIGEPRKTVDEKLRDVRPIFENFSANFAKLSSVPFNKIRYLGRSLLADPPKIDKNSILVDGVEIPLSPENRDDIEALIDTLKETHAKEKQHLSNQVKKLKKNRDKIIAEETKGLQVECEALIKENKRLKAFDPEEKDHTWSLEQMEIVETLALELAATCRRFLVDERIKGDFPIQAKVEAKMDMAIKCLNQLQKDWDEEFNADWG